jgi:hypothetical protein
MATTAATRTSKEAIAMAKLMTARINKLRKKDKKEPLSQSQVIALAIENLTVEMGVNK